jgi:ABC-type bacteriocin/lantibiotic exporter with double-glycine peptidase domain
VQFTTFAVALLISFVRGWKLTLVMVTLWPLMAVAGTAFSKLAAFGVAKRSGAYAAANTLAAQALQSVRTIAAFQAERTILARYTALLDHPRRISIRVSTMLGAATAFFQSASFVSCASNCSCLHL